MTAPDLPTDPDTGRPVWRGLPVPWIARWTGETPLGLPMHAALIDGDLHVAIGPDPEAHPLGPRAGYRAQRDEHGLLWQPDHDAPGTGAPEFAAVHTGRQRACMLGRLCQVCGAPFGDQPVTFLDEAVRDSGKAGKPFTTMTAPTCRGCAAVAMRVCPAQRRARDERVIVVAHTYRPHSVLGDVFGFDPQLGTLRLEAPRRTVRLGNAALTRTVAKQLCVEITEYTEEPVPAVPHSNQ